MKTLVLLNRAAGTLRTTDLDWFADFVRSEFSMSGHDVTVDLVEGKQIVARIAECAKREDVDLLVVAGGDGTVSAAAGHLMETGIALAILPAGTMNLFARTLQIPLDLEDAVAALAGGRLIGVDIATANGRPFVHQFAVGVHAKMVRIRKRIRYGSRMGKMIATTRAILHTLRRLPSVDLMMSLDGKPMTMRSPVVAVSNNAYGPGHIPYADNPRGGMLGVYICRTSKPLAVAKLALDVYFGTWRENEHLQTLGAKSLTLLHDPRKPKSRRAVCDGELVDLEERTEIVIHPGALSVLVPAEATYLSQEENRGGTSGNAEARSAAQ